MLSKFMGQKYMESEFSRVVFKSYSDHVHLHAVLEESPQLRSHFFPHLAQIVQPLQLLKGGVRLTQTQNKQWAWWKSRRRGVSEGSSYSLTLFNIFRTAGESGVYRIFPISRGLTEFHTIFVTGFDSSVCIRLLQKAAANVNDDDDSIHLRRTVKVHILYVHWI